MSIVIKNLCKSFGDNTVLKDVNLTIEDNEIVVLMGESGCGKTTLVRCLCDLEIPDRGQIIIEGKTLFDNGRTTNTKQLKAIHQEVGMVFQNYQLFPHRTIIQNICEAPIYQKLMSKGEAYDRAMVLLEKLNLTNKANDYPYVLSGGQKQRAAIARACILQPKIICFDEPTSALDPQSIQQLISVIQELKSQMSIIIITHDVSFGKAIGTRTLYMKDINHIQKKS